MISWMLEDFDAVWADDTFWFTFDQNPIYCDLKSTLLEGEKRFFAQMKCNVEVRRVFEHVEPLRTACKRTRYANWGCFFLKKKQWEVAEGSFFNPGWSVPGQKPTELGKSTLKLQAWGKCFLGIGDNIC